MSNWWQDQSTKQRCSGTGAEQFLEHYVLSKKKKHLTDTFMNAEKCCTQPDIVQLHAAHFKSRTTSHFFSKLHYSLSFSFSFSFTLLFAVSHCLLNHFFPSLSVQSLSLFPSYLVRFPFFSFLFLSPEHRVSFLLPNRLRMSRGESTESQLDSTH